MRSVTLPMRDERTLALRLRDEIGTMIERDRLAPGDKLPTEAELTQRFRVSRPALREALKLLEQDGIIYVEHGRGRFVSAMAAMCVERPITVFESVTDMVRRFGYRPVNKLLSLSEQVASPDICKALRLSEGTRIIRLERLRLQADEVIIYCDDYFPRDLVSERLFEIDWSESLLDILERSGSRPRMSSASVSAVTLPTDVVERTGLHDFGPALLISEVAFSPAGVPMIYARDYHRGSAFAFSFLRR
jgi:GntR family transcriptional regulator